MADFYGPRIGGVGGMIGDRRKPRRRTGREFERALRHVLKERPHLVVLHERTDHDAIHSVLSRAEPIVCVCGQGDAPLEELRGGAQVVGLRRQVVVLTAR